jgi:hypothetical protein
VVSRSVSNRSSSSIRAVSRPSRTARRRRSPVSNAGSTRAATAQGSGPCWATPPPHGRRRQQAESARRQSGMSTGRRRSDLAFAFRPARSSRDGPVPGSRVPNGSPSATDGERSLHALASRRQARSASVSPSNRASALGEPKRCSPADEQDPGQASIAPRLRVDVRRAAAHEAAQRDAAVARELDREARRRADRDEHRAAGDRRLLDELEREPPLTHSTCSRAAAARRGRPSRRPCPSRCAGRRPRGSRRARPRA